MGIFTSRAAKDADSNAQPLTEQESDRPLAESRYPHIPDRPRPQAQSESGGGGIFNAGGHIDVSGQVIGRGNRVGETAAEPAAADPVAARIRARLERAEPGHANYGVINHGGTVTADGAVMGRNVTITSEHTAVSAGKAADFEAGA